MNSTLHVPAVALMAGAVVIAVYVLRRVLAQLLVREVAKKAMTHVGEKALAGAADAITLAPVSSPEWKNEAAVQQQAGSLLQTGFSELGTFNVDKMPGVLIRMLFHPQTYTAAHIFDHPKAGSWIEFATRYNDGSSHCLTTLPATSIESAPWVRTIRADKSFRSDQLYNQFLQQQQQHGIKAVAPFDAVREFEQAYKLAMQWKKEQGLKPQEVAKVTLQWAEKTKAATTNG